MKSGPAGLFEDEMWIGRGGQMCALLLNFTKSTPAVSSVNDCTGSDFKTSRIARTGNEKSNSIAVRACSDSNMPQGQSLLMGFIPVSSR